jgi:hypothetical protein
LDPFFYRILTPKSDKCPKSDIFSSLFYHTVTAPQTHFLPFFSISPFLALFSHIPPKIGQIICFEPYFRPILNPISKPPEF